MAIVTSRLKDGSVPSEETLARIKDAAKYEVTFDEDYPELTDQELSEFKPVNPELRANHIGSKPKKSRITITIDADVLQAYRESGKGYQARMNDALRNSAIAEGWLPKTV